ncbi:uncharacterized protein LOC105228612 isoform X1 [Bactrocera dorsalis]|uniref:Uncharacterized protein LOC105228612 isoform X1 n=1 Tax=Bactrocera dorsalis TaxID=27457 RepID=A0ABM3JTT2_BACDO|nr:uncharacterized protein LOC105228612 isoform X1 [Bactrocera dorsalis]XP_049312647.1 uncharacterized protein LOC105228612 isoform X1 [Bactrocera dorsalis]XP_049312648.1 uncharacterized protein LOC105228612 isoform X1 [Bactrocera dorsalis]XP_049312649.1 uncharacterized protein LOC105228612 isoform X1 [Bactrocera dorsalis]XP_049312650.1 uncharacterized protein LOC105228612 isoform X1 [Bactrocera dorsalis]XP_049312651.1 uncharacterized protein LOC105228612 isoform X1 [Bactrocera dorsalis]
MANKIIFSGLIVALLHVASTEEANPEPYMNDAPLTIYVDAGKEIDQFLSLAKSIDGKLSVLEDTLERMSAEIKATEERCTRKVSELERKLEDLINLQTKSSAVATRPKRPAELACEKMNDIRSAGRHNKTIPYIIHLIADDGYRTRSGVLIEKRFVLITVTLTLSQPHIGETIKKLEFSFSDKVVSKKIKKVHPILEYDNFDAIALVELASDVDYNYWLYPTCLYTSEIIPKSDLMHDGKTLEIAEDSNCFDTYSKEMSPFEICVYDGCNFNDNIIFVVEEETTPQLFGFKISYCTAGYRKLLKVSPYLDLIENIVWPNNAK